MSESVMISFQRTCPASVEALPGSPDLSPTSASEKTGTVKALKKISSSKFPIFLAYASDIGRHSAMKIFPYSNGKINDSYLNESRFSSLVHPNIISCYKCEPLQKTKKNGKSFYSSYILMELAKNDFGNLLNLVDFSSDEKLVRTYFHQMVDAVEYLHSKGIAHMDLKPENFLLSEDFRLKVTDFDLAYQEGDTFLRGQGSINYRAPETINKNCKVPFSADIFSLGVCLFLLRVGHMPYLENEKILGKDFFDLLLNDLNGFWRCQAEISEEVQSLSDSFKNLFESLVHKDPQRRATIQDIKNSEWYQGPIYSFEELSQIMLV